MAPPMLDPQKAAPLVGWVPWWRAQLSWEEEVMRGPAEVGASIPCRWIDR